MMVPAAASTLVGDDAAAPGRARMRDWGRLAEMQQQHQQHHYLPVPELQQLLMETGRAANGGFFRDPAASNPSNPSPVPPAPHFRMMDDRHILHQLAPSAAAPSQHRAAAAPPPPMADGSSSFKLLPPRDEGEEEDERNSSGGGGGGSSSRWPSQEAQALIKIRAEMDGHFKFSMLPKAVLWDEVSRKLGILGYSRDARKCKEKFENLCKYYRRTKEGKAEGKSYKYFDELEALFKKQNSDSNNVNVNSLNDQREAGHLLTLIADGGCSEPKEGISKADGGGKPQDDENSSSESSADYDEHGDEQKGVNASKRAKKSSWKARFAYIESMVKKFMEKQEAAQQKFLELLEKREQERMKKDEAWRKQEIERLNREYELRMEEHARRLNYDAALVSALQKATGHVIEVPQPPAVPSPYSHTNNIAEGNIDEQNQQLSNKDDSNNKRWPKPEVQALIQLRVAMEPRFQEVGPKGQFWDEIATRMSYQGYHRSAKRCKEKWENINKYYRKTCSKKRPENAKTCPYFQELDALYQKGIIGTPGCNRSSAPGSHKLEETTDDLEDTSNRDDSSHAQGEAEVLSLPGGAGNNTPSNATTNTTTGLFSSPENCVNNTESRLPSSGNHHQQNTNRAPAQKRSWIDGSGNGSSLGLGFDAGSSDLFVGSSNKTLKFDGFAKEILDAHSRQFDEQQRASSQRHQQQEEHHQHQHHHHHLQQLLQGRQGQEFQEVESRGCNLVDSFGLGSLGSSR